MKRIVLAVAVAAVFPASSVELPVSRDDATILCNLAASDAINNRLELDNPDGVYLQDDAQRLPMIALMSTYCLGGYEAASTGLLLDDLEAGLVAEHKKNIVGKSKDKVKKIRWIENIKMFSVQYGYMLRIPPKK